MLDNISESPNTHSHSQPNPQPHQQPAISNSQIVLDFDSILQELKSVGQAHQVDQQTTMVVENITANIKSEPQASSQNQSIGSNDTCKHDSFLEVLEKTVRSRKDQS
jgi:uncharacterized protein YejL (UPF0352 family)